MSNLGSVLSPSVMEWLRTCNQAVLATTRADGSRPTSNVAFAFDGTTARVSVTADRAKTRNLRRNQPAGRPACARREVRAVRGTWLEADVGAVSLTPGDWVGRDLLAVYEQITRSRHPDPDEFYAAMVDERRLVVALTPRSATSWGLPT